MAHMLPVPMPDCLQRNWVVSVRAALGRGMEILVQLHTQTGTHQTGLDTLTQTGTHTDWLKHTLTHTQTSYIIQ